MEYQPSQLYGAERAVNAVVDYLRAHYAEIAELVNQDFGDDGLDIMVTAPDLEAGYSVSEWTWQMLPQRPCVGVFGEATIVVNEMSGYLQHRTPITIVVVDEHADKDTLRRMLYRHVAIILRCLLSAQASTGIQVFWQQGGYAARYSPITIVDETFFSDAQVYCDIQLEETHPYA